MKKLLILYGSSRKNGNTQALTRIVLDQLDPKNYEEINLLDYHIESIIDKRHTEEGFLPINDDYEFIIKKVLAHDYLLFVTPLYWYGMSGLLKNFIDRWTESLRNKDYDFKEIMKEKKAYLLTVGGPISPFTALPLVQQFQLIAQFMEMDFVDYLIGKGVKPKEVLEDEESKQAAALFGKKLNESLEESLEES